MKIFGYRFHFSYKGFSIEPAERSRDEFDLNPSIIEWHIREFRSPNGLR